MNKRLENGKMYNKITIAHTKYFSKEGKLVYENKLHFVDFQQLPKLPQFPQRSQNPL